jgi:rhamnose utilization protein RhaD (predicted bifunctional aldolase and dehydrogenase)
MTTVWRPDAVPPELVALTRRLGDPARDLVVLAEGNTSTRLPDGTFAVKASGAGMASAGASDFVVVDPTDLLHALDGRDAGQDEVTAALSLGRDRRPGRPDRASIETLVHLAALQYAGASWVAHTHPTAVVGLLACARAEELWHAPLFPDEAVVLGRPAFVPYAEPGLALGRAVARALRRHLETEGVPPRLVLLGNHGIVALGSTPAEVEAVTTMCVKAARVRAIALTAGGPAPLEAGHGAELAARPDEAERWTRLGGAR